MFETATLDRPLTEQSLCLLGEIDSENFGCESGWRNHQFLFELPAKWNLSAVATVGGRIAGFAVASQLNECDAHVHRIAVAQRYHRRGIGRGLIRYVESQASALGLRAMTLEFPRSLDVASFYSSVGYEPTDEAYVREYLTLKGKSNLQDLYLPLASCQRHVYRKAIHPPF